MQVPTLKTINETVNNQIMQKEESEGFTEMDHRSTVTGDKQGHDLTEEDAQNI